MNQELNTGLKQLIHFLTKKAEERSRISGFQKLSGFLSYCSF